MACIPHRNHTALRRTIRSTIPNVFEVHHKPRFSPSQYPPLYYSTTTTKTASLRTKNPPCLLFNHHHQHYVHNYRRHHGNHIPTLPLQQQHRTLTSSPSNNQLHNQNLTFTYPDLTPSQLTIRTTIQKLCTAFPESYWNNLESTHTFPHAFHSAIAKSGFLGICMPQQYGGQNLGISEAAIMLQTISESGGAYAAASAVHMNIFGLEPVRKYGSEDQKRRMLTPLIAGEEKACFGVTEPNTGLDTTRLQSFARKSEDGKSYLLRGSKIWISTAQVANKILILVRTTPLSEVKKPSQGLSLFYTDLDRAQVDIKEIPKMGRAAVDSNLLFFDDWKVPATDLIGEEGNGFRMIMVGMNAERILIAAEALGIGFAALKVAVRYARDMEQGGGFDLNDVVGDDYGYDYDYNYDYDGKHKEIETRRESESEKTTESETRKGKDEENKSETENETEDQNDKNNKKEAKTQRRKLGSNQSIQHPLADIWMHLEAARLMVYQAARLYDSGFETGEYANAAKYLAAEAAWRCCERAILIVGSHCGSGGRKSNVGGGDGGGGEGGEGGGGGDDGVATDLTTVERYLRESLIPRIAPVSREMICNYVGEKVLGLPRSY